MCREVSLSNLQTQLSLITYRSRQTDEAGQTNRVPSTAVAMLELARGHLVKDFRQDSLKLGENIGCRCMLGHDPQRQKEGEEAKDMQEKNDAFSQRQVPCKEHVEANREHDE